MMGYTNFQTIQQIIRYQSNSQNWIHFLVATQFPGIWCKAIVDIVMIFNRRSVNADESIHLYTCSSEIEKDNYSIFDCILFSIPWRMLSNDIFSRSPNQVPIRMETHFLSPPHSHLHSHSNLRPHPQLSGEQVLLRNKCPGSISRVTLIFIS